MVNGTTAIFYLIGQHSFENESLACFFDIEKLWLASLERRDDSGQLKTISDTAGSASFFALLLY